MNRAHGPGVPPIDNPHRTEHTMIKTRFNTMFNTGINNGIDTGIQPGTHTRNHTRKVATGLALAALASTGCGNGYTRPPAAAVVGPTSAPAPVSVAVKAGTTALGRVLVGPDGRTLYGFTNDVANQSTCSGTCATAWPPVIVSAGWQVAPGLDSGLFRRSCAPTGRSS